MIGGRVRPRRHLNQLIGAAGNQGGATDADRESVDEEETRRAAPDARDGYEPSAGL